MQFGYTPFDPIIVIAGTIWAAYLWIVRPGELISWMPVALSLYFFIPTITLLTLFQTVPLFLAAWFVLNGPPALNRPDSSALKVLTLLTVASFAYALLAGSDLTRGVIRSLAYVCLGSTYLFGVSAGRSFGAVAKLQRGLLVYGVILAGYGAFQVVAQKVGLPYRGILRGTDSTSLALADGLLRPNSLLSEPKRMCFVLFLGAISALGVHSLELSSRRHLPRLVGVASAALMLLVAILGASSSFLAALGVFVPVLVLWRPRIGLSALAVGGLAALSIGLFDADAGILEPITDTVEERGRELEVGIHGEVVYRQEFFARDYMQRFPSAAIFGVGLGQYFEVFRAEYGIGVGKGSGGVLLPLNAAPVFLSFDISGIGALMAYLYLITLVGRLFRAREDYIAISLLFLVCQSLTIDTLLFCALFAGVGAGRLSCISVDGCSAGAVRGWSYRFSK